MSEKLSKKFFDGLKDKYDIDEDLFNKMDFKCCGIFIPPENEIIGKNTLLTPTYKSFFNNTYKIFFSKKEKQEMESKIKYKTKCVCKTKIRINCFIYSKEYNKLLCIGSCCNKHFNENGNKRFCVYCNEEHNNRKNNICNDCRDSYKQCFKCGDYKKDNYELCNKCKFSTIHKTCLRCLEPKTHNTYQYCYNCNMKKKHKH